MTTRLDRFAVWFLGSGLLGFVLWSTRGVREPLARLAMLRLALAVGERVWSLLQSIAGRTPAQTSLSASRRFLPGPSRAGLFSSCPWQAGISLLIRTPCVLLKPFGLPASVSAGLLSFRLGARAPGRTV